MHGVEVHPLYYQLVPRILVRTKKRSVALSGAVSTSVGYFSKKFVQIHSPRRDESGFLFFVHRMHIYLLRRYLFYGDNHFLQFINMLAQEDFYFIMPSNTISDRYLDNRPHHYKIELPQEIVLQGEWQVGLTEVVFSKRWYQPRKIPLSENDMVWQITTQEGKPFVTKELPPGPYPDYYTVFEHVIDAIADDLAEAQIESVYDPATRNVRWNILADRTLRFPYPMARVLGFFLF